MQTDSIDQTTNSFIIKLRKIKKIDNFGLILSFIILIVVLSIFTPRFFSFENFMLIIRQAVFVAIIGFGMTFVIGAGGIDLSVGSILAVTAAVCAHMLKLNIDMSIAIILTVILGIIIGSINGLLITKLRLADFIVTLATMSILRGVVKLFTKGYPIYGVSDPQFTVLAQGFIFGIPVPVLFTGLLFLLCFYLLYKTKFGRYVVTVGENYEAARLVGINSDNIKIIVYSVLGGLTAIAGILLTSRLESALAETGVGLELDVIAAVVIGGNSLSGGKASLLGTTIGALLMSMVRNGLNLMNINVFWHQIVIGLIILIAVSVDFLESKK